MAAIRLESFRYSELQGQDLEWSMDGLILGQLNLLVGKNATGKSRVLNVLGCLARVLSNQQKTLAAGNFDATFSVDGTKLRYVLENDGEKVTKEQLFVGDEERPKLDRKGNNLLIFLEKRGEFIEYEPGDTEVSAVSRKDVKQHSFLLPLYEWAVAVRHYHFGSQLGKDKIMMAVRQRGKPSDFNEDRDEDKVVAVFAKGKKEFKETFTDAIITDMNELGYALTRVDTVNPNGISIQLEAADADVPADAQLVALGVCEEGIPGMYSQISMSQGMFRALSILAQINYSQLSGRANCILVDDIGEGLDFERSTLLIEILRRKAKQSQFQLTMSTNDKFVMNRVPLDEWSILQRKGNQVTVRNIHNARAAFEDFKYVGMSNFAFFEVDFANPESEVSRQLTMECESRDE